LALLASDPEQCHEPLDLPSIQSGTPAFAFWRIPEETKQSKSRLWRSLRQPEVLYEHYKSRIIGLNFIFGNSRLQFSFWWIKNGLRAELIFFWPILERNVMKQLIKPKLFTGSGLFSVLIDKPTLFKYYPPLQSWTANTQTMFWKKNLFQL
jgi:hypothetical protein